MTFERVPLQLLLLLFANFHERLVPRAKLRHLHLFCIIALFLRFDFIFESLLLVLQYFGSALDFLEAISCEVSDGLLERLLVGPCLVEL